MNLVFTYLTVAITFFGFDMIWLRTMVERLYRPVLGDMLRSEPDLAAAAVFYLAYPAGLIWFAVLPAQQDGGALRAFASGALLGCFTYATYDLTNQATLRSWSTGLSVADICWGSVLAGVSAWAGFLVAQRMMP
ncbi:putative membrane protein [Bradyrhizobium sp. USDA 4472]